MRLHWSRRVPSSSAGVRPQLVSQTGIGEKLPRLAVVVFVNQNSAGQNAERSLDHAHVLVEHEMMDIGAIQQRADRRDQYHIVGSNQFPHVTFSCIPTASQPRGPCQQLPALAAPTGTFYGVMAGNGTNCAKLEIYAWR